LRALLLRSGSPRGGLLGKGPSYCLNYEKSLDLEKVAVWKGDIALVLVKGPDIEAYLRLSDAKRGEKESERNTFVPSPAQNSKGPGQPSGTCRGEI